MILGALFGGVLVAAGALGAAWLHLGFPTPVCHFREWTGIPCPTCGSTRLAEALLSGDIVGALAWNPLIFFGLAAVALWALSSAIRLIFGLPAWRIELAPRESLALRIGAAIALILGWAYLIWRGV